MKQKIAMGALLLLIGYAVFWIWHEGNHEFQSAFPFLTNESKLRISRSMLSFDKSLLTKGWDVVEARLSASPGLLSSRKSAASPVPRSILITLDLNTTTADVLPSLWPNAHGVELKRARTPAGPFTTVKGINGEEANVPLSAMGPSRIINGKPQPQCHYSKSFMDTDVSEDGTYFYKLRFLDGKKKQIFETGICSASIVTPPRATLSFDEEGYPCLQWQTQELPKAVVSLRPPKIVVKLACIGELGRFSLGECSSFKSPIRPGDPVLGGMELSVGFELLLPRASWSLGGGQADSLESEYFATCISMPAAQLSDFPDPAEFDSLQAGPRAIIVRSSADSDCNSSIGNRISNYPKDSGMEMISWEMPSDLRLDSVTMSSPYRGRKIWSKDDQSIYNMGGYTRELGGGLSERYDYTYAWASSQFETKTETRPDGRSYTVRYPTSGSVVDTSVTVSVVRAPLPLGLMATPGDGFIRLSWLPLQWDSADWIDGPYFILRRSNQDNVNVRDNGFSINVSEEFIAGDGNAVEYIDRDVVNGQVHCYALEIRGVTRAKSWVDKVGLIPCNLPVRSGAGSRHVESLVAAIPGKSNTLRIALYPEVDNCAAAYALQMHLERRLDKAPSFELVERSTAVPLIEERMVSEIQTAKKQALPAANLILRICTRKCGYGYMIDVWMEDFYNSQRQRLVSIPIENVDFAKVSVGIVSQLESLFPGLGERGSRGTSPSSTRLDQKSLGKIIVAGFKPFTEETMRLIPAGESFDDLFMTALSQVPGLKIADREKVRDLLKELELLNISSTNNALHLGKVLKADTLLTGQYGIDGDRLLLAARLVDVNNAKVLKTVDVEGSFLDMMGIAEKISTELVSPGQAPTESTDLMRWIEAQAYNSASPGLAQAQVKTFVSPETASYHYDVGMQYKAKGEDAKAYDSIVEGMNIAEKDKTTDSWRFYLAGATLLRSLGRIPEEVDLWKRAIGKVSVGVNLEHANRKLAECLMLLNRNSDAQSVLDGIASPSYGQGRLYEQIGCMDKAIRAYLLSIFEYASYSALIRIYNGLTGKEKMDLAVSLAPHILAERPAQVLKLASEVQAEGSCQAFDLNVSRAAEIMGDSVMQERILSAIAFSKSETPEMMIALEMLAKIKRKQGDNDKAVELLRKGVSLKLKDKDSEFNRQRMELFLRNWKTPVSGTPAGAPSPQKINHGNSRGYLIGKAKIKLSEKGFVALLDGDTNSPLWEYDMHARQNYSSDPSRNSPIAPSFMAGGVVYMARDLDLLGQTLVVRNGILFVSDIREGVLHAVDIENGKCRWKYTDWSMISRVHCDGDNVYLGNSMQDVSILSMNDGRLIRRITHPPDVEIVRVEKAPFMNYVSVFGTLMYDMKYNTDRFPSDVLSYSVKIPEGSISIFRLADMPAPRAKKEAERSPLDQAIAETLADMLRADPGHGPFVPEEMRIVNEVKKVLLRCQAKDPEAMTQLHCYLTLKKYSLFEGVLAAGFVERLMPEKQFLPSMIKAVKPTSCPEFKNSYSRAFAAIGDPRAIPCLFAWLIDEAPDSIEFVTHNRLKETLPVLAALEVLSGQSLGPERTHWEVWWNEREKKDSPSEALPTR